MVHVYHAALQLTEVDSIFCFFFKGTSVFQGSDPLHINNMELFCI